MLKEFKLKGSLDKNEDINIYILQSHIEDVPVETILMPYYITLRDISALKDEWN